MLLNSYFWYFIEKKYVESDFYHVDLDIDDYFVKLFNKVADSNIVEWALTEWNIKEHKRKKYTELNRPLKFYAILYKQRNDLPKIEHKKSNIFVETVQDFKYNWRS